MQWCCPFIHLSASNIKEDWLQQTVLPYINDTLTGKLCFNFSFLQKHNITGDKPQPFAVIGLMALIIYGQQQTALDKNYWWHSSNIFPVNMPIHANTGPESYWWKQNQFYCGPVPACYGMLTHLPLDEMVAIWQTISSDAFLWMKSFVFWLKFHWSLLLSVQLTTTQHWFR